MQVKIFDYGSDAGNYYVVYKITGLDLEDTGKASREC